jgi:hydroxymethylpyrimidine/phosphomethylpyrimidine kinase
LANTGTILLIAGLDPGGGAGLLADVATCNSLGRPVLGAATCLTVQSLRRFVATNPVTAATLAHQLAVLATDTEPPVAVKVGLVPTVDLIEVVGEFLARLPPAVPVVLDPVLAPTLADQAVDPQLLTCLRTRLLPLATVLTPNLPELAHLLEHRAPVPSVARELLAGRLQGVLVKGGHGDWEGDVEDVLVTATTSQAFRRPRWVGPEVHGTGCALASCLAVQLANGRPLAEAVQHAIGWLDRRRRQVQSLPADRLGRLPLHPEANSPGS